MNKRQAKKAENKAILLQGMSYKENKKCDRAYVQYLANSNRRCKDFKGFNEDEKLLIEVGIFTAEEIISQYYERKETNRWRQRRKCHKRIVESAIRGL